MEPNYSDESPYDTAKRQEMMKKATKQLNTALLVLLSHHDNALVIPSLVGVLGNRVANSDDMRKARELAEMCWEVTSASLDKVESAREREEGPPGAGLVITDS